MALAGYFDQLSGLTADMLLAAMIDAGADPIALEAAMKSHHGVDCGINVTEGRVAGNRVTYTTLSCAEASVPETSLAIPEAGADSPAAVLIGRVIDHLEKNVNGLRGTEGQAPTVEALGGRHAALRILLLCNALHLLGIESLHHVALPFAAGIESTPPLQAALMKGAAIHPVDHAPVDLPGCAFLTALSAGPMNTAGFTLRNVGYGGDDADRGDGHVARLCVGEAGEAAGEKAGEETDKMPGEETGGDSVQILETQIDDMNPQFYGHVVDLLLEAGALDAFLTPVIMKKNRPGVLLTVLAPAALTGRLTGLIFRETTTIGLRTYPVSRSVLPRSETAVETPYGAIRIKVVEQGDSRRYTPEYEDCRQAALRSGVPLADVYAAVREAAGRVALDHLP